MAISDALLTILRAKKRDLTLLYEFYTHDQRPGADGFDPADAIATFGASRHEFRGQVYLRSVQKHAQVHRTSEGIFNSVAVTFSGIDGVFPAFASSNQVQGMHFVVRLISRSLLAANNLKDTVAIFTGECEKPQDADKKTWKIQAKQHAGMIDIEIPPRTYSRNDPLHSDPADPLFEGFRHTPVPITVSWKEKVKKGGLIGMLFGGSKKVLRTLQYTSKSDLDENEVVPIIIGRAQMPLKCISAADIGATINGVYAVCDGGSDAGIEAWDNLRVLTGGWTQPIGTHFRFGKPGGIDEQLPISGPGFENIPGNRHYSRTAWTAFYVNALSELDAHVAQVDDAPEAVATILGTKVPLPDAAGAFTLNGFSDNPAYITRWILTDPRMMGIPVELVDDAICVATGQWCDQYLQDTSNTDRIGLPEQEGPTAENPAGRAGVLYRLYQSMGRINPAYLRRQFLGDAAADPFFTEPEYEFFDPFDLADPEFIPELNLRRRWTVNCPITEKQKAIDFLNNIVFAASRLYLVQGTSGKIEIRVKRPVDNSLIRAAVAIGALEVPVESVLAWREGSVPAGASVDWYGPLRGKALIGFNLLTSEIRKITATRFSVAGNSITLAVTGSGMAASGATLAGSDGAQVAATGFVDVSSAAGQKVITLDGVGLAYTPVAGDTTSTVAGWLTAHINAHPTIGRYVKATWDAAGLPDRVQLQAKLGFLQFAVPLENAHSPAEEIIRVRLAFTSGASTLADAVRSNVIRDSVKFPLGSRQSTINQIRYLFRDAVNDFQLTELRVNDEVHQTSMGGKKLPKEINGTAVDNHHQAERAANGLLAELRDGDYFVQLSSDGEALLLDEGEVVAVTTTAGGFINLGIRLEDVQVDGDDLSALLVGRRYLSSMYDDTAGARNVPIPTTLVYPDSPPPHAVGLTLTELGAYAADGSWKPRIRVSFSFASYVPQQRARVQIKLTSEAVSAFRDLSITVVPDASNNGTHDITDLAKDSYDVRVITETAYLRADPATAPVASLTVQSVPPPPTPVNAVGTKDAQGNWRFVWDYGVHVPDIVAQGEEIRIYRFKITDLTGTVIKREAIVKTIPHEPIQWTYHSTGGTVDCGAVISLTGSGVGAGTIATSGSPSGECGYRSQHLEGDSKITFEVDHRLPPFQIALVADPPRDPEPGTGIYFDTTIPANVPKITPEIASSFSRRPLPGDKYGFEIIHDHVTFTGPDGRSVMWHSGQAPLPLTGYKVHVRFGYLDGSAQAAVKARVEAFEPEIFIYPTSMQFDDFGSVQTQVRIEISQISLNPLAGESLVLAAQFG